MDPQLFRENMIELVVIDALAGQLTPAVKILTLEYVGEDVIAHFVFREESPEDRAEIESNLAAEVSALTNGWEGVGDTLVIPTIEISTDHPAGYVPTGRQVFHFRD
jgi:hypothetical protein